MPTYIVNCVNGGCKPMVSFKGSKPTEISGRDMPMFWNRSVSGVHGYSPNMNMPGTQSYQVAGDQTDPHKSKPG